jgi:hypothetical protein
MPATDLFVSIRITDTIEARDAALEVLHAIAGAENPSVVLTNGSKTFDIVFFHFPSFDDALPLFRHCATKQFKVLFAPDSNFTTLNPGGLELRTRRI